VLQAGKVVDLSKPQGGRIAHVSYLQRGEGQGSDALLADLSCANSLGTNRYDCILLVQALHRIYNLHDAVQTLHRLLKPGGVLLATLPGIGLFRRESTEEPGYWAFTESSARELLQDVFPSHLVKVEAKGN